VPVDTLSEVSRDDRAEYRAQIDSHVEERKTGIAPGVILVVERSDQCAGVWLQQPCADDNQPQTRVEERQRSEDEREVAERDDDAADQHAAVLAK
jgi:hypothetical protein